MTMKTRIGIVFISAAVIALCGCRSSRRSSSVPKGGNTPREALQNVAKGFETENVEMIKAGIYVSDESREFANTSLDSMGAMIKLQQDLAKAYGKDAVKNPISLKSEDVPTAEEIEKMTFNEEGDTAVAQHKNKPLKFIKKDGRWFVDFSDEMPTGDMKLTILHNKKVAELAEKYRRKVGKEGYTADKIMEELNKEIEESTREATDHPEDIAPGSLDRPDTETPSIEIPLPPVAPEVPDTTDDDAVIIEVEPSTPSADTSADTSGPKAAMLKMAEAFKALDTNAILANTEISPKDKPYIEAMLKHIITIKTFENKLKAAYSSSELKAAGFVFSNSDNIPTPEQIDNMTFTVNGDKATATLNNQTTNMVKKSGRWLIVFDNELPPVEDRDKIMSQLDDAGKILNDLMPKIGAKGVTAQDISDEYQAALRKMIDASK